MGKTILMMYVTLLPSILSGVFNMIWCKLPILKSLQIPMDFNKNFIDKKIMPLLEKGIKGVLLGGIKKKKD